MSGEKFIIFIKHKDSVYNLFNSRPTLYFMFKRVYIQFGWREFTSK